MMVLYFHVRSIQNNVAGRMSTRFGKNEAPVQRTSTKSLPSEAVPPLPPRQGNKRASVRSTASTVSGVLPLVPPRSNRGHQRTGSDDTDNAPTRPPKRRKISQSSPSGNQMPALSKVRPNFLIKCFIMMLYREGK